MVVVIVPQHKFDGFGGDSIAGVVDSCWC